MLVSNHRVIGLGGLGHMAVKFGSAMEAYVVVVSSSHSKRTDALKLGAKEFIVATDKEQMQKFKNSFDILIDTVSTQHDIASLIELLRFEGVYCV